jgi:hypothetical protein
MKFIIRDDDLNYFSTSADITRWYDDIFAQDIPVGFAAIPFVKPTSDVYPFLLPETNPHVEEKEYQISENAELVGYVKSNALIQVLQHGCTHETVNGVYEYAKEHGLIEDTRRGKEDLEKAFGPIHEFAAPHDWISTHGVRGIEASHLNIIRGRGAGLRNWIPRWEYFTVFLTMLIYRFPRYISHAARVYPYVLNFGKHREVCSYRLEDADVFEGLEYVHKRNGIFVLVNHVHFMNDEKKARLTQLIKKAREYGAEFVAPSSIF